jgi:hypothetical protein
MFNISSSRTYKTLRHNDTDFTFSPDGIRLVSRASFEINKECPREYILIIAECINNGWIKPVAHMRDTEYTMELLQK